MQSDLSRCPIAPVSLEMLLGESDIALGPDWVSASGAVPYNDGSGWLDPPQSAIASLPGGHPMEARPRLILVLWFSNLPWMGSIPMNTPSVVFLILFKV